jgi:hypothetical protein
MIVHACNPSFLGGRDRRIMIQGLPKEKHKTLSEKHTKRKRTGDMVQVVEHLPNKC